MRIPLAWNNLTHQKARTAVAIAGVAFAVVLILMQLGFLGSVSQTATRVYDQLEFDILLASPEYLYLTSPGVLPRTRLAQAASAPGVAGTSALDVGFSLWRNPLTGRRRGILVFGIDPHSQTFRLAEVERQAPLLTQAGRVLADRQSREEFGPLNQGVKTEVGGQQVRIAGTFNLGTGFGADGAIIVGDQTFAQLFPYYKRSDMSLGLVRVAPAADVNAVAEKIRTLLPPDARVYTREEIENRERTHWVTRTSVGVIFGLGVVVAMVVGTAIVYQVLSSDIANHLPEYATLKAMGYGPRYLARVVIEQALILAVAGFLPGLLAAIGLYWAARNFAGIPIDITWARGLAVFVMSIAMCTVSGLASLAKVNAADPADLF